MKSVHLSVCPAGILSISIPISSSSCLSKGFGNLKVCCRFEIAFPSVMPIRWTAYPSSIDLQPIRWTAYPSLIHVDLHCISFQCHFIIIRSDINLQ